MISNLLHTHNKELNTQLEGSALGGGAVGHIGGGTAHLDLVQGAGALLAVVIGAAGHGAFDTGIGIHSVILLERENERPEPRLTA